MVRWRCWAAACLAYRQRRELRQELRTRWKYFLVVEGLTLLFFLAFLLVRLGNPDLWHPWKGGEKPMDFSYFNAVLRSTDLPALRSLVCRWLPQLLLLWLCPGRRAGQDGWASSLPSPTT